MKGLLRGGGHLLGEIFEEGFGDIGGGHAESAGGGGFHGFADVIDFLAPGFVREVVGFAVESFGEALGADAAGEAFAATLVGEEGHGVVGGFDHVAGVVEGHDAAGAEEGAVGFDAGVIEGEVVENLVAEEAAGESGHGDGLNGASFLGTSGPIVEEGFEWEAEGNLVVAGALDVAGEGDEFGAGVVAEAEGVVPFGALVNDGRNGAEGFDVVDSGGFVFESVGDGEGWFVAGEGVFTFERVEEGAFFTADVGSGSTPDVEVEGESGVEDVISQEPGFAAFGEAFFEEGVGFGVFVAEVDEAARGSGGKAGDDHSFDEGEGIVVHEGAVFETAGLAFVGVADDGFGVAVAVGDGFPFESGGESGTATACKFGGGDGVDDVTGRGGEGFFEGVEGVSGKGVASWFTDVGEEGFAGGAGVSGRDW